MKKIPIGIFSIAFFCLMGLFLANQLVKIADVEASRKEVQPTGEQTQVLKEEVCTNSDLESSIREAHKNGELEVLKKEKNSTLTDEYGARE